MSGHEICVAQVCWKKKHSCDFFVIAQKQAFFTFIKFTVMTTSILRTINLAVITGVVTSLVACHSTHNAAQGSSAGTSSRATATLSGTKPDTTVNGTVQFVQNGNTVQMNLQISVPAKANQSVAVHIHDHGECGNMGKDAMGHWNPTGENHGKWGSGAYHSGDIGNVPLDAQGNGRLSLQTTRWSIGGDAKTNILNRAIIVHSGVDDYTSQPAGNAGERIGCGVIQGSAQ
jgi:Cu-Zn family superoxide dismutase